MDWACRGRLRPGNTAGGGAVVEGDESAVAHCVATGAGILQTWIRVAGDRVALIVAAEGGAVGGGFDLTKAHGKTAGAERVHRAVVGRAGSRSSGAIVKGAT